MPRSNTSLEPRGVVAGKCTYLYTAVTTLGIALVLNHVQLRRANDIPSVATETRGKYFIYHLSLGGSPTPAVQQHAVTLATQLSTNNLHFLSGLVERWEGPISAALYVRSGEIRQALTALIYLTRCYTAIEQRVKFHVTTTDASGEDYFTNILRSEMNKETTDILCGDHLDKYMDKQFRGVNYQLGKSAPFPNNVLRNVARRGVGTDYVLTVDVDLVPSVGLVEVAAVALDSIGRRGTPLLRKTALVVPVLEIAKGRPIPADKQELVSAVKEGYVRQYAVETYPPAQDATRTLDWLLSESMWQETPEIAHLGKYEAGWEPYVVTHRDAPPFDEAFVQFGYNRNSQICELFIAGYTFPVLNDGFLVHRWLKKAQWMLSDRDRELVENRKRYRDFLRNLDKKYPDFSISASTACFH